MQGPEAKHKSFLRFTGISRRKLWQGFALVRKSPAARNSPKSERRPKMAGGRRICTFKSSRVFSITAPTFPGGGRHQNEGWGGVGFPPRIFAPGSPRAAVRRL